MLINLRDDDTNFFTQPADLSAAYGELVGSIPITIAAIPFVSRHIFRMTAIEGESRSDRLRKQRKIETLLSANELGEDQKLYPIGDNIELISFLSALIKKEKLEIALHGFNHRFYEDGAEMLKNHLSFYHIRDGKEYFEKLFDTEIKFFVPPSNAINLTALKWLSKANINLLSSSGIDTDNVIEKLELLFQKTRHNPHLIWRKIKKMGNYHYQLAGTHCLHSCTFKLDDTPEIFISRVAKTAEKEGFLSIASHYTTLRDNKDYQKKYRRLLELLHHEFQDIHFVTASHLLKHCHAANKTHPATMNTPEQST